jgi:hypothetical protein
MSEGLKALLKEETSVKKKSSQTKRPSGLDALKAESEALGVSSEATPIVEPSADSKKIDEQIEESLAGLITPGEIKNLRRKYNIPESEEEVLKDMATYFGVNVPGHKAPFAAGLGMAGEITGGWAQKYTVSKQNDPTAKAALQELRELAESRKTALRKTGEIAGQVALPAGIATKTTKGMMGLGALSGASGGVAQSKPGEELEQGATGAAVGAVLGGALGRLLQKTVADEVTDELSAKATREVNQLAADLPKKNQIEMHRVVKETWTNPENAAKLDVLKTVLDKSPEQMYIGPEQFAKLISPDKARATLSAKQIEELRSGRGIVPDLLVKKGVTGPQYLSYVNYMQEIGRLERAVGISKDVKRSVKPGQSTLKLRQEQLKKYLTTEGPDFVERQWKRAVESDELANYMEKNTILRGQQWGEFRKLANKASDVKPLARQWDAKFGSNVEQTIDSISEKLNKLSHMRASISKNTAKLRKLTNKSGVSQEKLYKALDSGKQGDVPDEVFNAWKDHFETLRKNAESLGYKIEATENYVPHRRPDIIEYNRRLDDTWNAIPKEARAALEEGADQWNVVKRNQEVGKLVVEMEQLLDEVPTSTEDFMRLFNILKSPNRAEAALITKAQAAQQRTGDFPEWMKDKNLFELSKNWTSNTLRHAAIRDELAELQQFKQLAQKQGDAWTVDYVDKLQKDIIGTRTDTLGKQIKQYSDLAQIKLDRAARKLESEGKPLRAKVLKGAQYGPEIYSLLSNSIYPNLLGLSPRAMMMNLTSPILMNTPELGAVYGPKIVTQSMYKTMETAAKGVDVKLSAEMAAKLGKKPGEIINTRSADIILGNEGILPAQWTGELVNELRNELKRSALYTIPANAVEKWTQISMFMFEQSEKLARMQTYHTAKKVSKDLMTGDESAKKWFARLSSPSYKRSIAEAVNAGDAEKADQLIQRYFQSTNMFNYDRANMSAYGRYMGPIFSTFSKWPTHIAGRILQEAADRGKEGTKKIGAQLVAPYLLALAADSMLPDAENSPWTNLLVGSGGAKGWTAASSIKGFLTGEFFTPPALQALYSFTGPLSEPGDDTLKKLYYGAQDFAMKFVPGANLLKLMGYDLPQAMGVNVKKANKGRTGGTVEKRLQETQRTLRKLGVQ